MTTPRRTAGSAALLVVVIALSMQTGSALAGRLIESTGVIETLWLRTAIAAAILAALRPRSLRIPAAGDRRPLAALTLALLLMNLSFYAAISRAPLGIVVAVEFTGPLAVAVIGSRRAIDFVWIALAGLAVVAKRAVTSMDPLPVTTIMLVGSAVLLTPALAVSGVETEDLGAALVMGAAIAVLSSAFPYFLELFALSRVRAATYGVLLSIEPAIAALTGFLILGQHLTLVEGAAIAAVMAAAAGASWTSEPHRL
jgi:inner membrane transporter RhtA